MKAKHSLTYDSWARFKADFILDLFEGPFFQSNRYLFRGQGDADWVLESSFDRWYRDVGMVGDRIEIANRALREFESACELANIVPSNGRGDDAILALAQHYGLPTRSLDWTDSPYFAAFFAFESHLSYRANEGKSVAVWALSRDAEIWGKERGVELLRVPHLANVRLRNQRGYFTVNRTPFAKLEDYVAACPALECPALVRILIPAEEATDALADLATMGIDCSRMYPGYGGAAMSARANILLHQRMASTRHGSFTR